MSVELLTLSNDWVPAQKKKHTRKGTNVMNETKATGRLGQFLARKNIIFSGRRYGIDALGAMAQGLFASLLIGTIVSTLGQQLGVEFLITVGNYTKSA